MSALRLTMRDRPAQRVDLSALTATTLAGRSLRDVGAIALPTGNRTVRVDELFTLEGTPGPDLEILGAGGRLDRIGAAMSGGSLRVDGDAGAYLGLGMTGGAIEVTGNVGPFAGSGMAGGRIRIGGDAGDFLGAALPGDHQGMRGGMLLVRGTAGDRAGDRMRRGTVLIEGNAGDYLASRMVAGTVGVWGSVGCSPGLAMRRGTVLLRHAPALLPTFGDCGVHPFTILTLLARAWRSHGGPFATLPDAALVRRLIGDRANDGRGELLVLL
jgi:formylmethanofuran dehydrogenase subunit C